LTIHVPLSAPSLRQSSEPCDPSFASNSRTPLKLTKAPLATSFIGRIELPVARPRGFISLTRTVPCSVPSLFQISNPCWPSLAEKKSVPLTFVKNDGYDELPPGKMSLTSVAEPVPREYFQSSCPVLSLPATKNNSSPTGVRAQGLALRVPART